MAEIVLIAFLQVLFDKLASSQLEEYGMWMGAKKELEKLESTLSTIAAVLEDAEDRQVKDKAVRNWLTKLKDAVLDADDALDEFATKALQQKVKSQNDSKHWVSSFLLVPKSAALYVKMEFKMKGINERLNAIALERVNFHFNEGIGDVEKEKEDDERRQTHSFVIESEIFGREKDKADIVDMLIGWGKGEDLSIIPIVGMGGMGKTTLAQLAFNDVKVKEFFKLRMWICVSEDFDVQRLTKAIIEAVTKEGCDLLGMDLLQTRLRDRLAGERFLLVLDDVWSEDYNKWDRLRTLLRGGAKGSKIIVTSRSARVAAIMSSLSTCYLAGLSEDDCWTLFSKRAFGIGGAEETPRMVAIGKEIVKKCGGNPLAVNTLGSLMHSRRDEQEWIYVKDNELWKLPQECDGILPALRISYNHLPSYLKRCFAYAAVFPKDYEINKDRLIQMWIAEGLVEISNCDEKLEDMGNTYFKYLVWRSFFQVARECEDGSIISCKIHDLMHDLAQFVAGVECSVLEAGSNQIIPKGTRHLSLVCNKVTENIPKCFYKAKNLHTLLALTEKQEAVQVPRSLFLKFRYLHVLILNSTCIRKLPNSLGKLIHLRLLDVSHTDIEALPKSITSLVNLQTLNLSHCFELQELPKNTRNLISLRHTIIDHCHSLSKMPSRIGELTSLQTLSQFIVGKEYGCRLGELKLLNLRGELVIKKLENVMYRRDAKEARLQEKHNLSLLKLSWDRPHDISEIVLEALKPHENLKRFHLKGYMGVKFPTWMMDAILSKLVEIKLKKCMRCEFLPPLGQLPVLKALYIRGMDAVTYVGKEFYGNGVINGFPLLEHFEIHAMPNLEEWLNFDEGQALTRVKKLVVKGCPKLRNMPRNLSSLEELELSDSNEMLLRVLPSLTSLATLRISEFSEVISLEREVENLTNLKSLHIKMCDKLVFLPRGISNLTSLGVLGIWSCSTLTSLPEIQGLISLRELTILNCCMLSSLAGLQHLTALEKLCIVGCPKMVHLMEEDVQNFTSLQSLTISHCFKFTSLPVGIQHMTTLRDLHLLDFPGLQTLPEWIENLKLLRELSIWDCPNLTSLPNAMQHLTSLEFLSIWKCPNLEKRCKKEEGEDWHKIKHVPDIEIKDQEIRMEQIMAPEIAANDKHLGRLLGEAKKIRTAIVHSLKAAQVIIGGVSLRKQRQ
ncbi:putative disease resistance protein RGA3 [Ricinus communis]|uniref:Leucine-rich repeat containing protein, putative n=1 Tax=Ricinus communis TaxID=3988 RepID=B9SHI8_RICCO|nr:putative disease resistance protein RGA3 [Ricinus communis]EEF36947.1 leucine-rich repeat containing protein, putative [Ricinus communis]|eukprot:XP_002525457.1 putative disease resistance protein RGA3 [Ricinus communis]